MHGPTHFFRCFRSCAGVQYVKLKYVTSSKPVVSFYGDVFLREREEGGLRVAVKPPLDRGVFAARLPCVFMCRQNAKRRVLPSGDEDLEPHAGRCGVLQEQLQPV